MNNFEHAPELSTMISQMAKLTRHLGYLQVIHELVLRKGISFVQAEKNIKKGPRHQCFASSAKLAIANADYTYVEGFTSGPNFPLPIHHAWVVDKNDRVLETTIKNHTDYQYIGVKIPTDKMIKELLRNETYGLFDTRLGYNIDFIKELDPELINEFEEFVKKRH
jgi:hypothetical protein